MLNEIITDAIINVNSFWQSVKILTSKPHVVNKRIWGKKVLYKCNYEPKTSSFHLPKVCPKLTDVGNSDCYGDYVDNVLQLQQSKNCDGSVDVVFLELLPKNYSDAHAFQLVSLVKNKDQVSFFDITPEHVDQNLCPPFSYTLEYKDNKVILKADCDPNLKSFKWLKDTVLPQFIKWGQESANTQANSLICCESLVLVSSDKYYLRYNDLKIKYGKELVKIWPECTDPNKFVYEDVAIATYLILLWEDERASHVSQKFQSFVDLGCGNGLLVYILTKEGYPGIGIDVRKRQIWDIFGSDVKLEERTITPSDVHLFPDTNWILGNHSDELTPWIPVIAARSSYTCNFFLLPCCAFNFDGTKYQRKNSSKSQYTEYLEYMKQLCEDVGFQSHVDRLKIPSTKRICFVGRGRTYDYNAFEENCNHIQIIINGEDQFNRNDNWINEFKSRDPVERVKNCTQIDKNVIDIIVGHITGYLLDGCNLTPEWSPGKTAELNELVKLVPIDQLQVLKSECGGLQTLLKNNHHIFKVQSGKVQLRYPKTTEEVKKNSQYKKNKSKSVNIRVQSRPCWFQCHHPQGCPLSDDKCSFLHTRTL